MYGAILGDIIGSPFEFDRGDKTKNFDLFSEGCGFTDDSVMTIAVGEALLAVGPEAAVKKIEDAVASNMQDWGKRYPHAGYGGCFRHWLKENNPKPYGSYGNGSAMRVSAVGWLYDSMERTREVARATANVTHNHPEGIKGAESTARLKIETVKDADEKEWIGVFTSSEEMHKGSAGNVQMNQSIESILRLALNWEQVNGIVINPFGKYIQMTKKMIELLINGYEYNENERKSKDDENN